MDAFDLMRPYSPRIHGPLLKYLEEHDGSNADNFFKGSRYFFIIKDKGFVVPRRTIVRVNRNPIPDACYTVMPDFTLRSWGVGRINMSAVGAEKGVYDPRKELRGKSWSIIGLNLEAVQHD